jgi:hypothetical protein
MLLQCPDCEKFISRIMNFGSMKYEFFEGNYVVHTRSSIYFLTEDESAFAKIRTVLVKEHNIPPERMIFVKDITSIREMNEFDALYLGERWWTREDVIEFDEFRNAINHKMEM